MDGCAAVPLDACGNNFGYKSCFPKPDMTCNIDACWLWTVDVMAVCPQFFPDLSEQLAFVATRVLLHPRSRADSSPQRLASAARSRADMVGRRLVAARGVQHHLRGDV